MRLSEGKGQELRRWSNSFWLAGSGPDCWLISRWQPVSGALGQAVIPLHSHTLAPPPPLISALSLPTPPLPHCILSSHLCQLISHLLLSAIDSTSSSLALYRSLLLLIIILFGPRWWQLVSLLLSSTLQLCLFCSPTAGNQMLSTAHFTPIIYYTRFAHVQGFSLCSCLTICLTGT